MKKILFVYDHEYPHLWRDGLYAALKLLEADYEIEWQNLQDVTNGYISMTEAWAYDFILGWGAFGSPVDIWLRHNVTGRKEGKIGLCIGGITPPHDSGFYDALFYETEWYRPQIADHPNIHHAFGVNTDIYKPQDAPKLFDYLTVGAFALWKRQTLLAEKTGVRLAIGQIQQNNKQESLHIITSLLDYGCGVMDMVAPETLAQLYNASRTVYLPADVNGGGERALLEARACGTPVEIELDNPKLAELLVSPVYDHYYYAEQLKKGIESVL